MQAKPFHPRRLDRSVKPVALLALMMAMALISAVLIVYSLVPAEPDPLSSASSRQTETFYLFAHEAGMIDHSPLVKQKPLPEPGALLLHSESF